MIVTLDSGQRRARKQFRCGLCSAVIRPGDLHSYQVNVSDDRAYTWRECQECARDDVAAYVIEYLDCADGDDGAHYWAAMEWAQDLVRQEPPAPKRAAEHEVARKWLTRAGVHR